MQLSNDGIMDEHPLVQHLVDIERMAASYFSTKKIFNPIIIDLEYSKPSVPVGGDGYVAQNDGLPDRVFGAIYRHNAKLWAHERLARITIRAAEILYNKQGWNLKIIDCLRTIEGQEAMQRVVQENGWSEEYVSPPGAGAHPRAMAIDIVPVDASSGELIDMGSAFDHFGVRSNRDFVKFCDDDIENSKIIANRKALDDAMLLAADEFGVKQEFYLLPSEWWDYRFSEDVWSQYAPLSDKELPENMRLTQR